MNKEYKLYEHEREREINFAVLRLYVLLDLFVTKADITLYTLIHINSLFLLHKW